MVCKLPGTRNNIAKIARHLCKVERDEELEAGADSFGYIVRVGNSLALPVGRTNIQSYSVSVVKSMIGFGPEDGGYAHALGLHLSDIFFPIRPCIRISTRARKKPMSVSTPQLKS